MRRRIVTLTVFAALLATGLFALPLGIAVLQYFRDDTKAGLERAADSAALEVSGALSAGLTPQAPKQREDDVGLVGIYSPDGWLLADVWQTTWVGSPHTVEVHVASLRGKLGDPALVQTVRGVGYRLRTDR